MDQRMLKFRWKQKYYLHLKTLSTREYMFLKWSVASNPVKIRNEIHNECGGCGSVMYNCHSVSLKGSPGDLNDNVILSFRPSMVSQKFLHGNLKCCHSKVYTSPCQFIQAVCCWLCWGGVGWNRYIFLLLKIMHKYITSQGYRWKYKQSNQKVSNGSAASWEYLHLWPGERQESKNGMQRITSD